MSGSQSNPIAQISGFVNNNQPVRQAIPSWPSLACFHMHARTSKVGDGERTASRKQTESKTSRQHQTTSRQSQTNEVDSDRQGEQTEKTRMGQTKKSQVQTVSNTNKQRTSRSPNATCECACGWGVMLFWLGANWHWTLVWCGSALHRIYAHAQCFPQFIVYFRVFLVWLIVEYLHKLVGW